MATTYAMADQAMHSYVLGVAYEIHPDLEAAGVSLGVLWADGGLRHHGMPAAAVVRITGSRERAQRNPDAVIIIDRERWATLEDAQRRALVDHEAAHLVPVRGKAPPHAWALDVHGRPRLRMRKHDCEIGLFFDVVERHGKDAIESGQYLDLNRKMTQLTFHWG
jgi:hypothetical protein